jgi:hypothetical protein
VAWFIPRTYSGPSPSSIAAAEQTLIAGVPMQHCKGAPVPRDPIRVLRDVVRAQVTCKQHGIFARFIWFSSSGMLRAYASSRAHSSPNVQFTASDCNPGPYLGNWHLDSAASTTIGQLMCVRTGRVRQIEWSDGPHSVYGIVRARESMHKLMAWWKHHGNVPV